MNSRIITLLITLIMTAMPQYLQAGAKVSGDVLVSGEVSAVSFSGNGTELTNIPGSAITDTSITVNHLANSAVTADKLADAAVTPGKIAFLGKLAIVAPTGGDYANPATAMGDYANWCGTPSATNTCLLKIMPGTYNIGTTAVQMQNYIDIEGSGENTTVITGNVDSSTSGVVNGASNTELRYITIKNTGGGIAATAIYNSGTSIKVTNVTATASGATSNFGIMNVSSTTRILNATVTASGGNNTYAVMNHSSTSATLINVTATASGGILINMGVYNHTASATLFNVTATGTGGSTFGAGVNNYTGATPCTVKIDHSKVKGSTFSVAGVANFTTLVSSSEFGGGSISGPVTCAGVYNASYTFYPNYCP